jgi:PKD repeat protein
VGYLGALVLSLLLFCGCVLFNQAPTAVITAWPRLSGASPLTVTFRASSSSDPDGEIKSYSWDFGDGKTSEDVTVDHTFYAVTETKRYNVKLTVVDDGFASDTATQTIEVLPGEGPGGGTPGEPVARIVVDPVIGVAPVTISFDATTSEAGTGTLVEYQWHFGDEGRGTGMVVNHTYDPAETGEFVVTLYVWNSEGDMGWDQTSVIVLVPTDVVGDEEPVAKFSTSDPLVVYNAPDDQMETPSLYEVTFDPGSSYSDAGHSIDYYAWDFGDGETQLETTEREVTHTYQLLGPAWTFVVRLTVYDDYGLQGTTTTNLTLEQPVDE